MKKSSNDRNMMLVASMTMLSKIVALLRYMVLTYIVGATSASDAFILSQTIPNVMFMLVTAAVGTSFIPVYNQAKNEKGDSAAENFTTRTLNYIAIIASIVVLITLVFSRQIIFLFASGFDPKTASLAAQYLRISIFSVYFIGMCGVFSAYLRIKGDFFFPSVIGIALSITEIIFCLLAYVFDDVLLAVGVTAAAFAQFAIVFVSARKRGYRYQHKLGLKDEYIKKALLMAFPIMIGLGFDEINVIIDKAIASGFQAGSISALNYSSTLVSMVHLVISGSINTVLFTEVSKLAIINDRARIAKQIQSSLSNAMFFLIPATVGLIVFSKPIVQLLFQRGNFTPESTVLTAEATIFYSLSIIPNGVRAITQSYFYAYGKTKLCMYIGVVGVAINIGLNILLSRLMGINGLPLATSIVVFVSGMALFVILCTENKEIEIGKLCRRVIILLMNSTVMGVFLYFSYRWLCGYIASNIAVILSTVAGCAIYMMLSKMTKTIDANQIKNAFKK